MPTEQEISFVRVMRDCPWNDEVELRISKGQSAALIYDFDVIVAGEKVATWSKHACGRRGYELFDLNREIIKVPRINTRGERTDLETPWLWRVVSADTKADFASEILKEWAYIPTPKQIEQRRLDAQAKAEREAAEKAENVRLNRIKEAGPKLLDALKLAAKTISDLESAGDLDTESLPVIMAAINEAEGDQ